jgi:UDP-N-acetyl-D-glucosamine dehydrogenase
MAYKPNVHDTRESPSLEIHRQLVHRGADVRYADPWVSNVVIEDTIYESVTWEPRQVAEADLVVMLTPHREFLEQPLWRDATLIVDTRNVIPADQRDVWGI